MQRAIKLRWARKLMKSKYFVLLTDKESAIALDGVNPAVMNDILALRSQAAAIQEFYEELGDLVKEHEKAIEKILAAEKPKGVSGGKATTNRKSKAKKIEVKEG